jgi:hypothetical protein
LQPPATALGAPFDVREELVLVDSKPTALGSYASWLRPLASYTRKADTKDRVLARYG